MSTGRICPRCLRDIVIVCQCRVGGSAPATGGASAHVKPLGVIIVPKVPAVGPTFLASSTTARNVGTSLVLEKSYSRPSCAPTMSQIRPVYVLREAFEKCISRPRTDLVYISDQLKSIRQDLTVQSSSGADTAFNAMVYEYHARVSLLLGNAPEFGQCLTNVYALHAKGLFGTDCSCIVPSSTIPAINPPERRGLVSATTTASSSAALAARPGVRYSSLVEFSAYRIVYTGLMSTFEDALANEMAYLETKSHHHRHKRHRDDDDDDLQHFHWSHPLVDFAVKAVNNRHNAVLYLALAARAPSAAFYALMMMFVPRIRVDWLRSIAGGVSGLLPAEKLKEWLGLGTVEAVGELLAPIAGDAWSPRGLMVHRAKERLTRYIAEVTEQRSLS